MEWVAPMVDDNREYITAWIMWQHTVFQWSTEEIALTLNYLGIPAWLNEPCWTAALVTKTMEEGIQ